MKTQEQTNSPLTWALSSHAEHPFTICDAEGKEIFVYRDRKMGTSGLATAHADMALLLKRVNQYAKK